MSTVVIGADGENIDQIQSSRDRVVTLEEVSDAIKLRVRHRMAEIRGREEWMKGRFPAIRENLANNLADATPRDFEPHRELLGRPAVVVSAGPSLEDDRQRVANVIWYVTNQAAAVWEPDVFVCCESFAVSCEHSPCTFSIIDAACHPSNIPDGHPAFFLRSDAIYSGIAKRYSVEMLPYGSSVSTAAVAAAAWHKAPVIVLLGQDLAIHPDGRYYAAGIPGSEMRVTFEEHNGLTWAMFPKREAGKMSKPPTPVTLEDGLWVTQDFADLRAWFTTFAELHPEIVLINATSNGIDIPGWANMSLDTALEICAEHRPKPPQPARFPELCGDVAEDLRRVRQWEAAVPESILWEFEERTQPHKQTSEETIAWAIEAARNAATKMGLI